MSIVGQRPALSRIEGDLRHHFRQLRAYKASFTSVPVFALEHPLLSGDTSRFATLLSEQVRVEGSLSDEFWVTWVVCATEHGYQFAGLEYWESFERKVRRWHGVDYRENLRKWFERFAKIYGGAEPSGAWSTRYKYICWPVTHALLPQDLQLQLAQAFHYAQSSLNNAAELSDRELGRLIKRHSLETTTRYSQFLEQEEIVGQVVHALLRDYNDESSAIYRPTLDRITQDLTTKANAREWLRAARDRYGQPKSRLITGQPRPSRPSPGDAYDATRSSPIRLCRPSCNLELRRGGSELQVWLSPPSLALHAIQWPELRDVLNRSRLIAQCADSARPAICLLATKPPSWRLNRWPNEGQALLEFDAPLPNDLEKIVGDGRLSPCHLRIFECMADGRAVQRAEPVVRPGADYIIASQDLSVVAHLGPKVSSDCEGIHFIRLRLPEAVTDVEVQRLTQAGIDVRRTLSVQPGGLLPRGWLSGYSSEWLTTEAVVFLIDHDFQCDQLLVELDGTTTTIAPSQGFRSILSLGYLEAGPHYLVIRATVSATSALAVVTAPVELHFMVRPPSTWKPGQITHDGLLAHVSPPDPSIEDLLSSGLSLHVEGATTSVACSLTLIDGDGVPCLDVKLFRKNLPLSNDAWQSALNKFLKAQGDERPLFSAREGVLTLCARDIGCHRIQLRADFKPLRWALDRTPAGSVARLLNDGIEQHEIDVVHYTFDAPLERRPLTVEHAIEGLNATAASGLLVARTPEFEQAVIISPAHPAGLSTLVDQQQWPGDLSTNIGVLVQAHRRWHSCRTSNGWARVRQVRVVSSIHQRLLAVLCGEYWVRNEAGFADRALSWHALESLVDNAGPRSFGSALSKAWSAHVLADDQSAYVMAAREHFGLGDHQVVALRACCKVAVNPDTLLPTECGVIEGLEERLRAPLVRGARLWQTYRQLRRGVPQ